MSSDEPDRQLQAAASANQELAALLAGKRDAARPRPRRATLLVVAVAVVALGWLAVRAARSWWRGHEGAVEIDRSLYILPGSQRAAPAEEMSPFTGFAVSIETDPPGAVVSIGGKVRGEAPVLSEITCRGAEKVEIRAEKAGYRPARRQLGCRADTLVKMTLRLER